MGKNIAEFGFLHPIVVDEDGNLIVGCRRLEACRILGGEKVPVNTVPLRALVFRVFKIGRKKTEVKK
ncbi:ParB N-terminal domain-containing protein [Candidatus Bathyarchaeota archaeon]|nr:ParB N-terminal domain-containing protein [Candidatus Bathyarchaeota archaeon]